MSATGIRAGNRMLWEQPAPDGGGRVRVRVWSPGPDKGTWWVLPELPAGETPTGPRPSSDYKVAHSRHLSSIPPRPKSTGRG